MLTIFKHEIEQMQADSLQLGHLDTLAISDNGLFTFYYSLPLLQSNRFKYFKSMHITCLLNLNYFPFLW